MLAALALTIYALLCLAICVGVALFVAYPARGRDLPGRLRRWARPRSTDRTARGTTGGRRVQGEEMPQRG